MDQLEDIINSIQVLQDLAAELSVNQYEFAFRLYHEIYLMSKNPALQIPSSYRFLSLLAMSEIESKKGNEKKARAILSEGINYYPQELVIKEHSL